MGRPTSELLRNGHVRWNVALEWAVFFAEEARTKKFNDAAVYAQLATAYALIAQVAMAK